MQDDPEFALAEAEQALLELRTSALVARDWDTVTPLLDTLAEAVATGMPEAIQRATGRIATVLAVREPRRIGPPDPAEEPAPDDTLERLNELVHAIVVRRQGCEDGRRA